MDSTARVNVFINDDDALKKLQKLQQAYEANTKELERLTKAGKANSQQAAELKAAQDKLTQSMADQRQKAGLAAMSYKDLKSAYRELYNEWARAIPGSDQRNKLQKELGDIRKRMDEVKLSSAKTDNIFAASIKGINKYAGAILVIGKALSALGIKMPDVIGAITDFDKTFRNVQTLMSDADKNAFSLGLKKGQIDLIKNYGAEISDVNKALFDTISAGIPAGDATKFMNDAMVLSVGGVTDLSVAVDGLTSVMNAYGISANDTEQVASAFFTAQKYGKTTVAELASNIGKVAPVANSAGIGMNELMSSLAVLTTKGIKTAEATTGLKAAISGLLKPSAEAEEVLRAYGVPVGATEIQAAGLGKTLEALNGLFAQNRDDLARAIPSVEAYNAVAALTGETLQTYGQVLQQVNTDYGAGSSLQKAYGENMNSVEMQTKRASGELKAYILQNETLKEGYLLLVRAGGGLLKFFVEYRWLLLSLGVAVGTYTAKAKVLDFWNKNIATGFTTATTGVKGFVGGLKAMGRAIMANPLGIILGAATALIPVFEKLFSQAKEYNAEAEVMARVNGQVSQSVKEEETNIMVLHQAVTDTTLALGERREALKKLQEIVPEYHGALDNEGKLYNDNVDALDRYIKKIQDKALAEAYAAEYSRLAIEKERKERELADKTTVDGKPSAVKIAAQEALYSASGGKLGYSAAAAAEEIKKIGAEADIAGRKLEELTKRNLKADAPAAIPTEDEINEKYRKRAEGLKRNAQAENEAVAQAERDAKKAREQALKDGFLSESIIEKDYAASVAANHKYRLDLKKKHDQQEIDLEKEKNAELQAMKAAAAAANTKGGTPTDAEKYKAEKEALDRSLAQTILSITIAQGQQKMSLERGNAEIHYQQEEYYKSLVELQEKYGQDSLSAQQTLADMTLDAVKQQAQDAAAAALTAEEERRLQFNKEQKDKVNAALEANAAVAGISAEVLKQQGDYMTKITDDLKKKVKITVDDLRNTLYQLAESFGDNNPIFSEIFAKGGMIDTVEDIGTGFKDLFAALKDGGENMGDKVGAIAAALSASIGNLSQSMNNLVSVQTQISMDEEEARYQKASTRLKKHYDEQINAAAGNEEEQQRLREEYAQRKEILDYQTEVKKLEIEKKAADAQFSINVGTAIAQGALAIVQCYAQLGPIAGSIAAVMVGATTAIQIKAMKAQRDAIKNKTIEAPSLSGSTSGTTATATPAAMREVTGGQSTDYVRGYEEGGYTDISRSQDGRRYRAAVRPGQRGYIGRPTILVGEEGGEFVANAQATRNPHLRPVFDIIDAAQRRGTVARLNMGVIARSLSGARVHGYAAGGYTSDMKGAMASVAADNGQVLAMMAQIRADIDRLNTTMGQKHKAYVVLSELNEVQQKMDDAKKFARR